MKIMEDVVGHNETTIYHQLNAKQTYMLYFNPSRFNPSHRHKGLIYAVFFFFVLSRVGRLILKK